MFLLFALWVSRLFLFIFSSKVAYPSGPHVFVYLQLYLYTFLVCSSVEREEFIQQRRRRRLSPVQNRGPAAVSMPVRSSALEGPCHALACACRLGAGAGPHDGQEAFPTNWAGPSWTPDWNAISSYFWKPWLSHLPRAPCDMFQ